MSKDYGWCQVHSVHWSGFCQVSVYSPTGVGDDEVCARHVRFVGPPALSAVDIDDERQDTVAGCVAWAREQVELAVHVAQEDLRLVAEGLARPDEIRRSPLNVTALAARALR